MKKVFLAVALVAATFAFSSCAKEDPAQSVAINEAQTGTVQGYIVMQESLKPNPNNNNLFYSSPASVIIRATVKYSELTGNASASGVYVIPQSNITYEKSTGKFTVVAPVSQAGCEVSISIGDISGTQLQADANATSGWSDVSGVYKASEIKETVAPGELKVYGTEILDFEPIDQNGSIVD